jgi:hypothetical protein
MPEIHAKDNTSQCVPSMFTGFRNPAAVYSKAVRFEAFTAMTIHNLILSLKEEPVRTTVR